MPKSRKVTHTSTDDNSAGGDNTVMWFLVGDETFGFRSDPEPCRSSRSELPQRTRILDCDGTPLDQHWEHLSSTEYKAMSDAFIAMALGARS